VFLRVSCHRTVRMFEIHKYLLERNQNNDYLFFFQKLNTIILKIMFLRVSCHRTVRMFEIHKYLLFIGEKSK